MKVAPKPNFGEDTIDLEPLEDHTLAVYVRGRKTVQTSYGEKEVTFVTVITPDATEPLNGAVFQSYFQTLEPGEWYVGRLEKQKIGKFRAWVLSSENLPKSTLDKLEKLAAKFTPSANTPAGNAKPKPKKTQEPEDEVPF
jgi:hypothetical protein